MENLINTLNEIQRGKFVRVASLTKVRFSKPKSNPFAGKEVRKFTIATYQFAVDYGKTINGRLERNGYEADFVAEKNRVGESVEGMEKRILYNANTDEFYAQFYCAEHPNAKVVYYINGKKATEEEVALIKEWTYHAPSKKQAEYGLTEKQQLKPRSITLSNILWVKSGKHTYSKYAVEVAR